MTCYILLRTQDTYTHTKKIINKLPMKENKISQDLQMKTTSKKYKINNVNACVCLIST